MSVIALIVAMTGGAYAAFGPGSVGSRELAKNAVTAPKIKAGAVGSSKLARGSVTRPRLANQSVGVAQLAPAAVGRTVAFANVPADGDLLSDSRGLGGASANQAPPGVTCFFNLPEYETAVVTPVMSGGLARSTASLVLNPAKSNYCEDPETGYADLAVVTYRETIGEVDSLEFSLEPFTIALFR